MKKSKNKTKTDFLLEIEKFFTEQLWQLLIVVAFVSLCAWLFDKWVEAIMFCIAHTIVRRHFDKQYHCGTTSMCTSLTLTIAFFGIATILPVTLSLLSTVPMCWFISWIGYIAQDRIDITLAYKTLKTELEKKKTFNTDTCTEQELIFRCNELKLSEENTRLAIEFFIKKTKHSKIADELCVEEHAITTRKLRLKKKLNNNTED